MLWPDRHGNAVRHVLRWSLRHSVAFREPDELRPLRIGNDPLNLPADLQVPGWPVRVGDRQRDCGLTLPVAVFLPPGGQSQIFTVEPEPGRIHLRSAIRPDRRQMRIQRPLQQSARDSGITGADADAIVLYLHPGPASVLHHHCCPSGSRYRQRLARASRQGPLGGYDSAIPYGRLAT